MRNHFFLITTFASVLLYSLSTFSVFAQLSLVEERSQLNFISYKNEHIAETHSFDQFSGTLSEDGKLEINVKLSSVNTIIPIRNERMKSMLFDVANYENATFTAQLDKSALEMAVGTSKHHTVTGELQIKDKTVAVEFHINLIALADGKFQATTIKPTLINASAFGLDSGIAALQEVAMLNSISKTVPLTFSVVFE